ncbi:MAG: hypothetical protein M0C28_17335 [Candidatus Moduliflexus flocculans]|nr:hypothetical protein [Candidatus Moduliflexus flocculans]
MKLDSSLSGRPAGRCWCCSSCWWRACASACCRKAIGAAMDPDNHPHRSGGRPGRGRAGHLRRRSARRSPSGPGVINLSVNGTILLSAMGGFAVAVTTGQPAARFPGRAR